MKTLYSILLLAFLVSCSDTERQRTNDSSTKIDFLTLVADDVYEYNQSLINEKDSILTSRLNIFTAINDTLALLRDELISVAGGYTTKGQYFNLPAINYVNEYFYGESNYRNNSYQDFFENLDTFIETLAIVFPESNLESELNSTFDLLEKHYGIKSRELIFKDMALNEAVQLIEGIRLKIAFEQTKYILTIKNEG